MQGLGEGDGLRGASQPGDQEGEEGRRRESETEELVSLRGQTEVRRAVGGRTAAGGEIFVYQKLK